MKRLLHPIVNPLLTIAHNISTDINDNNERRKYAPRIIPPRALRRSGGGIASYISGGQGQMERLIRLAGLTPASQLLDVGCGDGRLASALFEFFEEGSYRSFEVQKRYLDFLKGAIARKNPKFSFEYADLWHSYYNPRGQYKTEEYVFPYDDNTFDIVFLNSIFTHFLPVTIAHYLDEINRVLKPDGTVLATYFIANDESIELDKRGLSATSLRGALPRLLNYSFENYWSRDQNAAEPLVIVDEGWLKRAYETRGCEITNVVYETWCGRYGKNEAGQDMIVARKHSRSPTVAR